jgi:hypothetical protein
MTPERTGTVDRRQLRTGRGREMRWLGAAESAWLREAKRHFGAHPHRYQGRESLVDRVARSRPQSS